MLSHNTTINTKYFDILIKMRSKGKNTFCKNSVHGHVENFELEQANYFNLDNL